MSGTSLMWVVQKARAAPKMLSRRQDGRVSVCALLARRAELQPA
jgi:hypothetical protein